MHQTRKLYYYITNMYRGGICFITDRSLTTLSVVEMTRIVLLAGIRFIQYREKTLSRREIYEQALLLRDLTNQFDATLIINDHADIALAVDADGAHLGQEDLPLEEAREIMGTRLIGISTHSLDQAVEAEAGGADYIGYGPMFRTSTKNAGPPLGLISLKMVQERICIPIVAIGGIQADNIASVFKAGADAAALASGILRGDPAKNAGTLLKIIRKR